VVVVQVQLVQMRTVAQAQALADLKLLQHSQLADLLP
jgi:hypothetical protein